MAVCIPRFVADKLSDAFKADATLLKKLNDTDSAGRRKIFGEFLDDAMAQKLNANFEEALISEQKDALTRFVERTLTPAQTKIHSDLFNRIDRYKKILTPEEGKAFMEDLAARKLGMGVTEEEAKAIVGLKQTVDETKVAVDRVFDANLPEGWRKLPIAEQNALIEKLPKNMRDAQLEYGRSVEAFKEFVGDVKVNAEKLTREDFQKALLKSSYEATKEGLVMTKSLLSSLDNSFFGRQGIRTLLSIRNSDIWVKNFVKSFPDMLKSAFSKAKGGAFSELEHPVMKAIKADIYSRPNALNGAYTAAKNNYGLGIGMEEAFPVAFPERIPVLGRLYKASEVAFNGGALRMRADLADRVINAASKAGLDVLDKKVASDLGRLVAGMTGRGGLGSAERFAGTLNTVFFSPRYVTSLLDTMTLPFNPNVTPFVRKEAAKNLTGIVSSMAGILATAEALNPGSVEFDPRSANFGKIHIGDTYYDISGGMNSLITLAARMATGSTKSGTTGKVTSLVNPGFGGRDRFDVAIDFMTGKFAPASRTVVDALKGEMYGGKEFSAKNVAIGLTAPLSVQKGIDLYQSGNADMVAQLIAEGLGFGASTPSIAADNQQWDSYKEAYGEDALKKAQGRFNSLFQSGLRELQMSEGYKDLTEEDKNRQIDDIRASAQSEALSQ